MKLHFDSKQEFQLEAIKAVTDIFEGQPLNGGDFEFSLTRASFSVGARYKILERLAVHPHITYGKVAGDDKKTEEFYRRNRNLNFKSNIWELNVNLEAFTRSGTFRNCVK